MADSIDPRRVHGELVRHLETMVRYVRRQGLTDDQVREVVARELAPLLEPTSSHMAAALRGRP